MGDLFGGTQPSAIGQSLPAAPQFDQPFQVDGAQPALGTGGGQTDAPQIAPGIIAAGIGALGSLFGGGGGGGASAAQGRAAESQISLSQEQFDILRPLLEAFVNQQISQNQAVQPLIAPLLQAAVSRFQGAGQQATVGPIRSTPRTNVPGADAGQAAGGIDSVLASVPSPAEQASATGRAGFGETTPGRQGTSPNLGDPSADPNSPPGKKAARQAAKAARTGVPTDPSRQVTPPAGAEPTTPAITTPVAEPVAPFEFNLGQRDFDAERSAVERLRTDVERQGQRGLGQLQLALGQRFGGSAAAGSLAAGAGAELQSRLNEQFFQGTDQLRRENQALEAQRFNQLAQIIGAFSGVNVNPALAAGQQASSAFGSAANIFGQQALFQNQQQLQSQQAFAGLANIFGQGGFGGLPGLGTPTANPNFTDFGIPNAGNFIPG